MGSGPCCAAAAASVHCAQTAIAKSAIQNTMGIRANRCECLASCLLLGAACLAVLGPGLHTLGAQNGFQRCGIGRVRTGCLVLVEKVRYLYLYTPFQLKIRAHSVPGRKHDSAQARTRPALCQNQWQCRCVCQRTCQRNCNEQPAGCSRDSVNAHSRARAVRASGSP